MNTDNIKSKPKLRLKINRNLGHIWSPNDDEQLLAEIKNNTPHNRIEYIIGRTFASIQTRLHTIACHKMREDLTLNDVVCLTKMNILDILSALHSDGIRLCQVDANYHIDNNFQSTVKGNYLFIDTEYTDDQHLLEIYWEIRSSSDGRLIKQAYHLVNQGNIPINNGFIHGITIELTKKYGEPIISVLAELINDLDQVDTIIAHNFKSAEYRVLLREFLRNNLPIHQLHNKPYACTLQLSKQKFKNISHSLNDVYYHCFNRETQNYHTAIGDTMSCAQIYYYLTQNLSQIEIHNEISRPRLVTSKFK
jgi:DNA polymerase III epsilon subunit-like protein